MKTVIRHIVSRTYKPALEKYLSSTRGYNFEGLRLQIPPGVFHPGFFYSTRMLLEQVRKLPLKGKKFLEPGCGSGLISLIAAREGAVATASDINPLATQNLIANCEVNGINVEVIESDLFDSIPEQDFDIIAINPPYYRKAPLTMAEHAWYCGENGEYFQRLFALLGRYMHRDTTTLMALCDGCDMQMIQGIAEENGFSLKSVHTKSNLIEKNFIFKIESSNGIQ